MSLTVLGLVRLVDGVLLSGDPERTMDRVAPIDAARPGALSFVHKKRFLKHIAACRAEAVLVPEGCEVGPASAALIAVKNPYLAFAQAASALAPAIPHPSGVHASAVLDPQAEIGPGVAAGPFVYVGPGASVGAGAILHAGAHVEAGASVGAGSILYNHVVVRHGCRVGARCILHPGVVIGADGFGFAQAPSGPVAPEHFKIPQTGLAIIEDDVEIGAGSCVDRGTLDSTFVRAGTKIDNLVQVGHNADIGKGCLLVAQSGVAGSSRLEAGATLGAQSGISGHLKVGAGATVYGQSGVIQDIDAGATVGGTPAISATEWFRTAVRLRSLGDLFARVRRLEGRVMPGDET